MPILTKTITREKFGNFVCRTIIDLNKYQTKVESEVDKQVSIKRIHCDSLNSKLENMKSVLNALIDEVDEIKEVVSLVDNTNIELNTTFDDMTERIDEMEEFFDVKEEEENKEVDKENNDVD